MKGLIQKKILAIMPHYTGEGANFTKVLLENREEVLLSKNMHSTLKDLCDFYHYNLKSSNKTYRQMLGVKKNPPIPITKDILFISVKTRIPIGKDDGAYSYINVEMVKGVKGETIYFKNKDILKTMTSQKTIEKRIKEARLIREIVLNREGIIRENEEIYMEEAISLRKDLNNIYIRLLSIEKNLFKQKVLDK